MTEYKKVEQQIASLAAPVDRDAFNRNDDQTLQGLVAQLWEFARAGLQSSQGFGGECCDVVCFATPGFTS